MSIICFPKCLHHYVRDLQNESEHILHKIEKIKNVLHKTNKHFLYSTRLFLKGLFSRFYIFPKDNNFLLSILNGLSKASLNATKVSPEHPDQNNTNN